MVRLPTVSMSTRFSHGHSVGYGAYENNAVGKGLREINIILKINIKTSQASTEAVLAGPLVGSRQVVRQAGKLFLFWHRSQKGTGKA
jgi:hypothetical protein